MSHFTAHALFFYKESCNLKKQAGWNRYEWKAHVFTMSIKIIGMQILPMQESSSK